MRAFISVTSLLLVSLGFAALPWGNSIFKAEATVFENTLQEMAKEKDLVLRDILADRPDFSQKFSAAGARALTVALNTIFVPPNTLEASYSDLDASVGRAGQSSSLGYVIGKTIKNTYIFTFENAVEGLTNPAKPAKYKYKYCEMHPEDKTWPCEDRQDAGFNDLRSHSREHVLARRVISHPSFIKGMCPLVTQFGVWYLNWGWLPGTDTTAELKRQQALYFKNFFQELRDEIQQVGHPVRWEIYGRSVPTPRTLDPQFGDFIQRRYLDGGPEYLKALLECFDTLQKTVLSQAPPALPDADKKVAEYFSFAPTGAADRSTLAEIDVDSVAYYKLLRGLSPADLLPENLFFNAQGDLLPDANPQFVYSGYITRIFEFGTSDAADISFELVSYLNRIDIKNRYSVMTVRDYLRLAKENPKLFSPARSFCVINEAPSDPLMKSIRPYSIYAMGRLQSLDASAEGQCFETHREGQISKSKFLLLKSPKI